MRDVEYHRDTPTCALKFAADLELFHPRQGEGEFSDTPIEIEVSMNEQTFYEDQSAQSLGFKLSFKRVIVEVLLRNCEITQQERYERTLPSDQFKRNHNRIIDSNRNAQLSGEIGLSGVVSNLLSKIGVNLSASIKAGTDVSHKETDNVQGQVSFKIVRWIGAGRWHIGHEDFGDPSELDGFLRGAYLHRPGDGRQQDDKNPLCHIAPLRGDSYSACIELRANTRDLVYTPLEVGAVGSLKLANNKRIIEQLIVQKMLKEHNRRDGLKAPDGEVILARGRITARKVG